MKLTKERKIYAGLFLVAVCAFIGNEVFSGPSEASAADAAPVASAPVRTAAPAAPTVSQHSAMTDQLAQRLRTLDHDEALSASAVSDPFKLSKSWEGASDGPTDNRVWAFNQRHHLTAVMVSGARGGSAIIDGELVRVGQSLEGFKLIEVSTRSATFECNKQIARLALSDN